MNLLFDNVRVTSAAGHYHHVLEALLEPVQADEDDDKCNSFRAPRFVANVGRVDPAVVGLRLTSLLPS